MSIANIFKTSASTSARLRLRQELYMPSISRTQEILDEFWMNKITVVSLLFLALKKAYSNGPFVPME
jgi:hypothetical protein